MKDPQTAARKKAIKQAEKAWSALEKARETARQAGLSTDNLTCARDWTRDALAELRRRPRF